MQQLFPLPTLHTFHRSLDLKSKDEKEILLRYKSLNFSSISNSQRALDLNFLDTVYNSVNSTKYYPTNSCPNKSLLWVGRLTDKKGPAEALSVAQSLGLKLLLLGHVTDKKYFEENIKKFSTNDNITIIINSLQDDVIRNYQNSYLTLFPIKWDEPFGLVMIESMACGTPVVAFANGAAPEVIKDGETGFLVNPSDDDIKGDFIIKKTGIEGLQEAVQWVYGLSENEYRKMRKNCRKLVEEKFTVEKMVDNYEKVYERILKERSS